LSYKAGEQKQNEEQKIEQFIRQKKNELAKYQEAITYYNEFGKKLSDEIIKVANSSYKQIDFFQYIQSLENAHPFKLSTWITCFNLIKPNSTHNI
jgi:hypothetical protein